MVSRRPVLPPLPPETVSQRRWRRVAAVVAAALLGSTVYFGLREPDPDMARLLRGEESFEDAMRREFGDDVLLDDAGSGKDAASTSGSNDSSRNR